MTLKSIVSVFVSILVSVTGVLAQVSEDLYYTEHSQSITITRCNQTAAGPVVIPAAINGKPVTQLNPYAFSMCRYVTSVDIQAPITSIGSQTFYECVELQGIKLPSTLTSIGSQAFHSCYKLTNVTIPQSVTSIGSDAFVYCERLADVKLPNKLNSIGARAFAYSSVKTVTFPTTLKTLGDQAFLTCRNLKKATFLGNAPAAGTGCFNETASGFTIYHHEGRKGFTTPTWKGYRCKKLSPEISILQPSTSNLTAGSSSKDFGKARKGKPGLSRTFTIKNSGTLDLADISVLLPGKQADFVLIPPRQTTLAPGESTKFKITFKPLTTGKKKAVVRIKSNDRDEASFDIKLTGTGTSK